MSKAKTPANNLEKRRKAIAKLVRRNNRERKAPKRAGPRKPVGEFGQTLTQPQPSVPEPQECTVAQLQLAHFASFHDLVELPSYGLAVHYHVEGEATHRVSTVRLCVGHAGQVIDALRSLANRLAQHVPDRNYYGSPR